MFISSLLSNIFLQLFVLNLLHLEQCQATNEEEIFEVQDKQSLFPLGWIHVSSVFYTYSSLNLICSFPMLQTLIYNFALPDTSHTILFHVINWCTYPLLVSGEFKRGFLNFSWDMFSLVFEIYFCYLQMRKWFIRYPD